MSAKLLLARERERKNAKRRKRAERRARRILRLPEVEQRTGKKHASIYADIAKGLFPAPIPLGPRAVGWLEDEIDDWLEERIAERDSDTAVRSLPLAGLNQRRKAEASSPQDVRSPLLHEVEPQKGGDRRSKGRRPPIDRKAVAKEARGVRGRGERETSHAR
jgi:prophage regulatory protein